MNFDAKKNFIGQTLRPSRNLAVHVIFFYEISEESGTSVSSNMTFFILLATVIVIGMLL